MNENKVAEGEFGYFDPLNREYVITRPDTPRPWYNYLMNNSTVSMISNTSGGVCYDKDPTVYRLLRYRYQNVPYDRPGRYIYIRDNDTGKYWSGCWAPVHTDISKCKYECRVGAGYNIITFIYNGIKTEIKYFIPLDRRLEIWDLKITNISKKTRHLSTFSYAEFAFWGAMRDLHNIDNCPNISRQKYSKGAIIHYSYNDIGTGLHDMNFIQIYGYHTSNKKHYGFSGDRDLFLGKYRDEKNPIVVEKGESTNYCKNSGYPIGSFEHRFSLKPGQTKRIVYQTGFAKNEKDVWISSKKYKDTKNVDKAFNELKKYWGEKFNLFKVKTPDVEFDTLVNSFIQYQASITLRLSRSISPYEWGISRGMGFRDSCQDQLGMMHAFKEHAKTIIGYLLEAIYPDGSASHNSFPLKKIYGVNGFYDDHNWLAITVCRYIKETGNISFLKEKFFYANSSKKGTVLEHLLKCNDYAWKLRGKNGLMQTGCADWNDSLNPGDKKTESTFTSALFCVSTKELIELLRFIGKNKIADKLQNRYDTIKKILNTVGWDGEWFKRMIKTNGEVLGSKKNKNTAKIFLEPQPWSIMAGVVDKDRAKIILDAVEKHLGCPDGHRLMDKSFDKYDKDIGSVGVVLGGIKENASVFNHASSWVIVAESIIGRGNKAMEYFKRICGTTKNKRINIYESEPYVTCQFVSQKPFHIVGRGRNPWLTGSATWMAVGAMQYIIGCRPEYNGLKIDPSIPSNWDGFYLERTFRGTKYIITVKNPEHVEHGVKYIEVNGKKIEGNIIPYYRSNKPIEVTVIMG
jgi:cellobiose phosphorylase